MDEDEDYIEPEYESVALCPYCNGSGEGQYEGESCHMCRGTGEERRGEE